MPLPAPRWASPVAPAALAAVAGLLLPAASLAHPADAAILQPTFLHGFAHPFTGLDHLLAMGAVGTWAGLRGGTLRWLAPVVFVLLLVAGALAGAAGSATMGVEPMVAASLVAFGLLIIGAKVSAAGAAPTASTTAPALACIAVFALAHGAAHGQALGAGPALAGMAAGSAVLHGIGLVLGRALRTRGTAWRAAVGGGTLAVGAALLLG